MKAHARNSDPETSHEAAASVNVTKGQKTVMALVRKAFPRRTEFTLKELVAAAPVHDVELSESGLRTRLRELISRGEIIRGEKSYATGRGEFLHHRP